MPCKPVSCISYAALELLRMEGSKSRRQKSEANLLHCLTGDVYITEKEAVDDEEAAKALDDFEGEWGANTSQSHLPGGDQRISTLSPYINRGGLGKSWALAWLAG